MTIFDGLYSSRFNSINRTASPFCKQALLQGR
jgi:hypothetical protein